MILQAGVAGPLVLALAIYTASHRVQGTVHRTLTWLLVLILMWMVGMVLESIDRLGALRPLLLLLPTVAMSPLFLLLMIRYARIELFEHDRAMVGTLAAPFVFFLGAFLTHPWHGLMGEPGMGLGPNPVSPPGPLFWAFQVWSNAAAVAGLGICVHLRLTSQSSAERRRMGLMIAAAVVPLTTHAAYMFRWLPISYPLTPTALGITSLLIVAAIRRYRLLEWQPLARRDVIEASSDAVLIADADGRVVDLNPAAARLLDADRGALCGHGLDEALARLGAMPPERAASGVLEALRRGQVRLWREIETGDGRVLELNAGSPTSPAGEAAGHFVVLRDRTPERRAERLLHQSQKLESVGILAAGVAHEVNNPLAFVRANLAHLQYLSSLLEADLDRFPKEVAFELGEMRDVILESLGGLDRIQGIVQGLLRFSQMPTGHEELCDVNAALDEAARFASLDRSDGARLDAVLAEGLPAVSASPGQLVQVFLNLLLNAKHALTGRSDGRIQATSTRTDDRIEVRIADNGPGVPDGIRAKIFDPFFTTRAPNEGTGLGLSIAFDIVRERGGTLELEAPPDGGACFVVRLPISPVARSLPGSRSDRT